MSAAKFDVVVFLAHVFDAEIEQRFFKLKQECSDRCDVVVLVEQDPRFRRASLRSLSSSTFPH